MAVQIKCPTCRKRVFDVTKKTIGAIEMKCPHCGKIIAIDFDNKLSIIKE